MTATQSAMILRDLKKGKRITPLDGLKFYGSLRLGARIYDLRRAGHNIKREMVEDPKTNKRFASYRLAKT